MNFTSKTQHTIQSLSGLISALSEEKNGGYSAIFKSLELPISELDSYISWEENCYTRNCIVANEDFELILICWDKGQKTAIHDHDGEDCWVYALDGEFREEIYAENKQKLSLVKTIDAYPKDILYIADFKGFHSLENRSNKRSLSLHLYAKPIKNCLVYCTKENQFVRKELSYDNVENRS